MKNIRKPFVRAVAATLFKKSVACPGMASAAADFQQEIRALNVGEDDRK